MVRVTIPHEQVKCQNWIGGSWSSGSGEVIEIESPLTGQSIGNLAA